MSAAEGLAVLMFLSFMGLLFTGFPVAWVLGTSPALPKVRMIELFSGVTFTTELPSGGVAPPNEMDVTVFSDVFESAALSKGLVLAPAPQDATNIAMRKY